MNIIMSNADHSKVSLFTSSSGNSCKYYIFLNENKIRLIYDLGMFILKLAVNCYYQNFP